MKTETEIFLNTLPFHDDGCGTDLDTQCWLFIEYLHTCNLDIDYEGDNDCNEVAYNLKRLIERYVNLALSANKITP